MTLQADYSAESHATDHELFLSGRRKGKKRARALLDPRGHSDVTLQADYSAESHATDHELFLSGRRKGKKRARALLDFQRQEEDELGFRYNTKHLSLLFETIIIASKHEGAIVETHCCC